MKYTSQKKQFIYLICFVIIIFAFYPLYNGGKVNIYIIGLSLLVYTLDRSFPNLFKPFFLAWMFVAKILEKISSPILMTFIYILLFIPVGFLIKLLNIDLLSLKFEKNKKSYWKSREYKIQPMKYQF